MRSIANDHAMPGDLHYGDNLEILRRKIATESVDLIYLDPPFNSDRTYNLLHKGSEAQQDAFFDTWHWDDKAERAYAELTGHAPHNVRVPESLQGIMRALKDFFGTQQRDTMAYLTMMAIRIVEMHRVLRKTGSLYLHCDPTASHYLKIVLDAIFRVDNFRSEVIWKRSSAHNACRFHSPVHDTILFYSKSDEYTWNPIANRLPQKTIDEWYNNIEESTGRRFNRADLTGSGTRGGDSGKQWRHVDPTAKGRHWAIPRSVEVVKEIVGDLPTLEALDALDEAGRIFWPDKSDGVPMFKRYVEEAAGVPALDVITSIRHLHNKSPERVGYATQKPKTLLTHLLELSSNAGDLVLDPFCGCGTTVESAEELGRKWIGIDVAIRAIDVIKDRLDEKFKPRVWKEYGEPSDVDSAAHLAETNPYDFQWWAVRKLGGQPPKGEKKKGGDGGIDGEMTLRDFGSESRRRAIISVKGGKTLTPDMVKSLKTTMDLEKADYGILVTMYQPSAGMRNVARECGTVPWSSMATDGKLQHRVMIVTAPEFFAGTVQLPGINITPRTQSMPPLPEVRMGETFHLPFPAAKSPKISGTVKSTKPRKQLAKTNTEVAAQPAQTASKSGSRTRKK